MRNHPESHTKIVDNLSVNPYRPWYGDSDSVRNATAHHAKGGPWPLS